MIQVFLKGMVGMLGALCSLALLAVMIILYLSGWSPTWRSFIPWGAPALSTHRTEAPEPEPIQEEIPPGVLPPNPLTPSELTQTTRQEPRPWQLMKETRPNPLGKTPYLQAEWDGPFRTQEGCEVARQQHLDRMNLWIARQTPGHLFTRRIQNGFEQTILGKVKQETWTCVLSEDSPS